jgi:hypothetical protein
MIINWKAMSMLVFWVATPCGCVGRYRHFEEHTASIFKAEVKSYVDTAGNYKVGVASESMTFTQNVMKIGHLVGSIRHNHKLQSLSLSLFFTHRHEFNGTVKVS